MSLLRPLLTAGGLLLAWDLLVRLADLPPYILPPPLLVLRTLVERFGLIAGHAATTAAEIALGMALGTALGMVSALLLTASRGARQWLLPVLLTSQALPTFALAPLLVLWLGYGMASKVAVAVLVIYFPVTAAFFDGLRRTEVGWLELARTMDAAPGAALVQIRMPAALPALASGLRVAAAIAPIGAVLGEWVGSSRGLGFLMLHANGRMQIDLMFAAVLVLAAMTLGLWFLVDRLMRRLVYWQPETISP